MFIDILSIFLEFAFIISFVVLNLTIGRRLDNLENKFYDLDGSLFGKVIEDEDRRG